MKENLVVAKQHLMNKTYKFAVTLHDEEDTDKYSIMGRFTSLKEAKRFQGKYINTSGEHMPSGILDLKKKVFIVRQSKEVPA